MKRKCSVRGCKNTNLMAKSLCGTHYKRHWKYGNPLKTKKLYRHQNAFCSIEGCKFPTLAKTLCQNHYALMRRNGTPIRKRIFKGFYIKDGYRYLLIGYRHYEPEHRIVMERFLKRKLKSIEHVHHIDGNILNNSPSNLQVVNRSEHIKLHIKERKRGHDGYFIESH